MKKVISIISLLLLYYITNAQEITIGGQVKMLALGDSYTIGESVEARERWPHQLIDELRKLEVNAEYPDYIAATGWTTRRLLQWIGVQLDEEKEYNLVSVLIGVNNQYQGLNIENYEPDLRDILDKALDVVNLDTSRVFMLSIPDYAYTPFGGQRESISKGIDAYNDINRSVAVEYGIVYVDITPISRNGLTDPSLVALDGLHPSGEQYKLWVQAILPYLRADLALSGNGNTDPADGSIKIYPNPASSILHVEAGEAIGRIRVYNMMGGLEADFAVDQMKAAIDLSHLAPGIYTLQIQCKDKDSREFRRNIVIQP